MLILEEEAPSRGQSQYKGPEVEVCLVCSRNC